MAENVTSTVPSILRPLSTDEYEVPARTDLQQQALATAAAAGVESAAIFNSRVKARSR